MISSQTHLRSALVRLRDDLGGLGALVPADKLLDRVIAMLDEAERHAAVDLLRLTDAAQVCGYSADHLGRLVREGKLINYGRPRSPRVRRDELPVKPGFRVLSPASRSEIVEQFKAQIRRDRRKQHPTRRGSD